MPVDFLVRRDDLRRTEFSAVPPPDAAPGQVLFRVDRFGFSANNITYALLGDQLDYWSFFPAPEGWGRIPVWGFGTAIASACDGVAQGERFFGYFPMSTSVMMEPARVGALGFSEGSAHRSALHPLYNQYARTTSDPGYDPAFENEQMVLRPVFILSYVVDDALGERDFFGARRVVISSASSKASYGLAFLVAERRDAGTPLEVVGLTSTRNIAFVEGLGCYDRVIAYDDVASIAPDEPAVFVDLAGDARVREAVHRRFGDALRASWAVGATHWENASGAFREAELPGPAPTPFFAPAQIKKRSRDWGMAGFQERFGAAWRRFMKPVSNGWMHVTYTPGPEAVERVYAAALAGSLDPREGHALSLST